MLHLADVRVTQTLPARWVNVTLLDHAIKEFLQDGQRVRLDFSRLVAQNALTARWCCMFRSQTVGVAVIFWITLAGLLHSSPFGCLFYRLSDKHRLLTKIKSGL